VAEAQSTERCQQYLDALHDRGLTDEITGEEELVEDLFWDAEEGVVDGEGRG